jgi:hypothetical protein
LPEAKDTSSAPSSEDVKRSGAGFELRLERGGAFVRLAGQDLAPGVRLESLTLQVPDVKFPFDVGRGAGQFRHRLADLVELAVSIDASTAEEALASAGIAAFGVEEPRVAARDGFLEIAGRLSGGPAFTLEAGLLPAGEAGVALLFHSPRVLGPSPLPCAALPHLARAAVEAIGTETLPREPLGPLLRRLLAPRGWKLPRVAEARLSSAALTPGVARIAWDRAAAGPAVASADPDLLAADEGARTFAHAEALVARGDYPAAREAYLEAGGAAAAHPFAAERLLSLLAHDERFHEEALDLAAAWLARRPGFGPALAAEANVRIARGEGERAARAFASLAALAAERSRAFLALAASEAAFAVPGASAEDALRAAETALAVRRDHVPALRAVARIARASGDREALLRANRRLVAYEADPPSKARAHAELGELLLDADPPGARLHLDQALRLAPDDADALSALARACAKAGEPLRAVRALDRLKELLLARGDRARAAAAALEAGEVWEGPLGHAENALLRYREASELAPSADAHARAARAATRAGQWADAADQHAAVLAAIDPASPGAAALAVRTRMALADVAERLGDAGAAAAHLEKASALGEADAAVLRRVVALQRSLGRPGPLLAALDRLAPLEPDPAARAALLAEAAEAALAAGLRGDARARFTAAAAADPTCRAALLGAARLASEQGDAVAERDALERLLPLAPPGAEAAEVLDRLAAARERTGDVSGALEAAISARGAAPTPPRLDTALRLARVSGDPAALPPLLAERARAAAAAGDGALATDAWFERARLLAASSPAQALAALAEARAVSPGHVPVLRAQADLAERTGEHRLALGCLRAVLAGGPDDAPALELRAARAALAAGEVQAAKDHAERAYARGVAGAAEILEGILARAGDDGARADVLVRMGRHLEAARLLERHGDVTRALAALERAAGDPATAPEALARLADLRLAAGDRSGAAEALLARARLTVGREGAQLALKAHDVGGDPAALDLAVARDPRFAPALARRAALRVRSDPALAAADAEAALDGDALPPDERASLLGLAAGAAAAGGDGARARRHLAAYCELCPEDDDALARLAALHRAAGALADVEAALERRLALARGGDAVRVRLELSDLLAARDGPRAARLALEALDHDPASAAALRAVTTAPRAAHVPPPARAALLARLAADAAATPAEAGAALVARAHLLAETGDAAGALAAARDAARLGPEPDDLVELRARAALATGDRAEAAGALLERARRARERNEPGAADRLGEAGLAALEAGVAGAEEALRAAVTLGPERDTARAVLEALLRLARERGDAAAERATLPLLAPLLPTGARPAALLRLSLLALEAGETAVARASAEEARDLAPRDLGAVEACRAAALAAGDLAAVAALLGEAALLDPSSAGPRLLDRARLLAALGRPEEADDAYSAAAAALPPDRAVADEQARLRRSVLPARPAGEPIEAFALRSGDPREAASALRTAAALAFSAGDLGGALRAARRAYARTQDDPGFAGPLLARILYLQGGGAEALVLHRRLLDAAFPGVAPDEAVALCRQAADLAAGAGERDVALRALDHLLRLRPQDIDASLQRFELDPDRSRAVRDLAATTQVCRSRRSRSLAVAAAGEMALADGADRVLSERLFGRARQDAEGDPALTLAVARRRAEAIRRAEGASSPAFLEAIHDASAAAQAAGDRAIARDLLEVAIDRQRERGLFAEAARDLLQLDALAAADGDFAESAARLREAGALQIEAGDLVAATETLREAYIANPESEETFRRLEDLLRARGAEGAPLLLEVLADRAARARPGPVRAARLVQFADAQRAAGALDRAEAALRAALQDAPGFAEAEDRLLAQLTGERRTADRARLLLERSAHAADPHERDALRREAAAALASSVDAADRELAAEAWRAVASAHPADLDAARAAAGLLVGLGRREDAVPYLTALVAADPGDEAAAAELAASYGDRPLERADVLLGLAERASGEARAARLREASSALFAAGEDARARAALRDAFDAWPADGAAFAEALRAATPDPARTDAVLSARARAVPAEAAACHRTRGDVLLATGRADDAIAAYEAAVAAAPDDPDTLAALAGCLAEARGDAAAAEIDGRLVARADAAPGSLAASVEAPSRYRVGLACSFAGQPQEAIPHLERALALAPFDAHAGVAWAALAEGHAARGDAAAALAAARARVERATALALDEELRAAIQAEADAAARLGVPPAPAAPAGDDAAAEPPTEPIDLALADAVDAVIAEAAAPRDGAAPEATAPAPGGVEGWIASAEALERDGGRPDEIRAALERAAAADPDAPAPWRVRARVEAAFGNPLAAARAHLSVSIRAEPGEAAEAAVEAARLFAEHGQHADAARAYRAANKARPGTVADEVLAAAETRARGAPPAAAAPEPDAGPGAEEDVVASILADQARAASGAKRADLLERLASHRDRTGDRGGAMEALLSALEADPGRDATFSWLAALSGGDPEILERAAAARSAIVAPDIAPWEPPADDVLVPEDPFAYEPEPGGPPADEPGSERIVLDAADEEESLSFELPLAPGAPVEIEPPSADAPPGALSLEPPSEATPPEAALSFDPPTPDPEPEQSVSFELPPPASDPEESVSFELPLADGEPAAEPPGALAEEEPLSLEASAMPEEPLSLGADAAPAAPAEAQALAREGRALFELGDPGAAYDKLSLALASEPSDLTIARDLSRVAEKLGLHDEYVQFGEVCADAIAAYDPLAAAARYRHFGEVLRDHVQAPQRAAAMFEKALALVPDDPDTRRELLAVWAEAPETAPRALEAWLDLARADPSDATALAAVAGLCDRLASGDEGARERERGRLAASIAAFTSPAHPLPAPATLAPEIPVHVRTRVAVPGATGPLARLLQILAPWLETLFPADLPRRGATRADVLDPARAPALAAALERAGRALRSRPHEVFLSSRPGVEIAIENTQPPAVIVGAGAAVLDDPALAFLAARTLDLLDHGWALVGKFAPKDVAILLELACRFGGGSPPSMGLPFERAGAFFAVLETQVSAAARAGAQELGPAASQELAETDPRALAAALRRTANRVGLLHAGDPGAALRTLALLDRRVEAGALDGAQALALPDLRDLALFSLSDPFLDLRAAILGGGVAP